MGIFVCPDLPPKAGMGHLIRTLTLAQSLSKTLSLPAYLDLKNGKVRLIHPTEIDPDLTSDGRDLGTEHLRAQIVVIDSYSPFEAHQKLADRGIRGPIVQLRDYGVPALETAKLRINFFESYEDADCNLDGADDIYGHSWFPLRDAFHVKALRSQISNQYLLLQSGSQMHREFLSHACFGLREAGWDGPIVVESSHESTLSREISQLGLEIRKKKFSDQSTLAGCSGVIGLPGTQSREAISMGIKFGFGTGLGQNQESVSKFLKRLGCHHLLHHSQGIWKRNETAFRDFLACPSRVDYAFTFAPVEKLSNEIIGRTILG